MKDYFKEGNILIMKELFEAFDYFYSGNKSIGLLAGKPSVAKRHYVKQELGNMFMYDCRKYGIKFVNISENVSGNVFECEITRYHVNNNNYVVDSMMKFKYDFVNERLLSVDYLHTPYSTLSNEEDIKVLYK